MRSPFRHITGPARIDGALRGGAVAIGNFDGVHRGHRALLDAARRWADARGKAALLLTFEPHPRAFFQPDGPMFRLTPAVLKARRAAAAGMDAMIDWPFDGTLAGSSAGEFARGLLGDTLGAAHVVTGPDFRFGKGRAGDAAGLAAFGREIGFSTEAIPPVLDDGAPVSSTRIRDRLAAGDVVGANALLGWEWSLTAVVRHGDKRGRTLGYPTANLHLDPAVRLAHGIYAVRATIGGRVRGAVASHGRRPTFDGGEPKLEVHIFDFAEDIYGREIEIAFVGYIRPELKFDSLDALIARMDADSAEARRMLAA